jgi:hypothetical protein
MFGSKTNRQHPVNRANVFAAGIRCSIAASEVWVFKIPMTV